MYLELRLEVIKQSADALPIPTDCLSLDHLWVFSQQLSILALGRTNQTGPLHRYLQEAGVESVSDLSVSLFHSAISYLQAEIVQSPEQWLLKVDACSDLVISKSAGKIRHPWNTSQLISFRDRKALTVKRLEFLESVLSGNPQQEQLGYEEQQQAEPILAIA